MSGGPNTQRSAVRRPKVVFEIRYHLSMKRSVAPSEFRGTLARDVAADYELVRQALFGAIEATTERWATCSNCRHRIPVTIPDNNARVKAVQLAVELGFGRAPTDDKPAIPPEDFDELDVRSMTAAELRTVWMALTVSRPGEVERLCAEVAEIRQLVDDAGAIDGQRLVRARATEDRLRELALVLQPFLPSADLT